MPLTKKEDFAQGNENALFCLYCVKEDGEPKSCQEVFEGGVQYFMGQLGGDRQKAEKVVRKNMNQLPYWKAKDCELLKGEMVTDEEFEEILNKL